MLALSFLEARHSQALVLCGWGRATPWHGRWRRGPPRAHRVAASPARRRATRHARSARWGRGRQRARRARSASARRRGREGVRRRRRRAPERPRVCRVHVRGVYVECRRGRARAQRPMGRRRERRPHRKRGCGQSPRGHYRDDHSTSGFTGKPALVLDRPGGIPQGYGLTSRRSVTEPRWVSSPPSYCATAPLEIYAGGGGGYPRTVG